MLHYYWYINDLLIKVAVRAQSTGLIKVAVRAQSTGLSRLFLKLKVVATSLVVENAMLLQPVLWLKMPCCYCFCNGDGSLPIN